MKVRIFQTVSRTVSQMKACFPVILGGTVCTLQVIIIGHNTFPELPPSSPLWPWQCGSLILLVSLHGPSPWQEGRIKDAYAQLQGEKLDLSVSHLRNPHCGQYKENSIAAQAEGRTRNKRIQNLLSQGKAFQLHRCSFRSGDHFWELHFYFWLIFAHHPCE